MTNEVLPVAKFRLGKIVTTPSAQEKLTTDDILMGIRRHQAGEWGDIPEADRIENDLAIEIREQLVSEYQSAKGVKFSLVTEADRSVTTVLLPQDTSSSVSIVRCCSRPTVGKYIRSEPTPLVGVAEESVQRRIRSLQIEAVGDSWKKQIKPKIRITGKWLERAGFKPGTRVSLICRELGFIELRAFGSISQSMNLMSADEIQNPS